ncbi:MAG TPA: hypothetical protein VGG90_09730 [Candidatus Dormibacteraeota bacterium]
MSDRDPVGVLFAWRLRAALDRVVPPVAAPRYQSLATAPRPSLRFAPATLLLAVTGVLALAAFAATGSANPMIWGKQATSVIHAVRTVPAAPPADAGPSVSPAPAAAPPRKAPQAAPAPPSAEHRASPWPEPSERPERSPSPAPRESPPPDGGTYGGRSPSPSPSPSPTPHDG